jgi:hypothetical protein
MSKRGQQDGSDITTFYFKTLNVLKPYVNPEHRRTSLEKHWRDTVTRGRYFGKTVSLF